MLIDNATNKGNYLTPHPFVHSDLVKDLKFNSVTIIMCGICNTLVC